MKRYFRNNRFGFLLFILLIKISILNAQHVHNLNIIGKDIQYKLDSGYYDSELRINRLLVKKSIFSKRTNLMMEEIIKMSDTSVCYIKYDEKLNVISKGLLVSDTSRTIDIKTTLHDFLNDPLGDKGLMYDYVSSGWVLLPLKKEGYWIEDNALENTNFIGVGYYEKGFRNGNWEFGLPYRQLRGDEKIIVKTQLIKTYRNNNTQKSENLVAPLDKETLMLSGNWYIIQNSGDSNFYLSRHLEKAIHIEFINFYTTNSCIYQNRSEGWAIKNNLLTLTDSGNKVNFKIDFITNDEIILKKMK